MPHAKTDSEVTSLALSSPNRSPPRRPLYYVQSPSQHDGEKMSFQSSPAGSPPHPAQYAVPSPVHHSRESSTSRFSVLMKKESSGHHHRRKPWQRYAHVDDDAEEGDDPDGDDRSQGIPTRCYFPIFVVCFVLLFTLFSLILWGASRPYKPRIAMKSITFSRFSVQAGMDSTGVPTDMLTVNSTLKFGFTNRATFFGVHVTATPVNLYYATLNIANGEVGKFYQLRKSSRLISIAVDGTAIPLYGAGSTLGSIPSPGNPTVPMTLTFTTRSRAYIMGKLVKTKFYRDIACNISFNPKNLGKPVDLKNSCVYS